MPPPTADTAVERVHEALRAEILSGGVALGSPLREEAAAERFAVSRHTVRAAFQLLVAERLAVAEAYRGVRVVSFDPDEIVALQQLRAALEGEAVRIAHERYGAEWPVEVLAPAEALLERLAALDDGRDLDWLEVERLHAELHRVIVAASGSPRIMTAHEELGSELLLFLLHVRPHYSLESLLVEHRELLDAVQRRGAEAMREHLADSTELLTGRAGE